MKHRQGTPGLTPYRLRTIEQGYPRKRRPARHLRRTRGRVGGSQFALGLAAAFALFLLLFSGYHAAAGAAVVLGAF